MSIKRITSVWDHSQHGGTTLLILLALADNADENGLAWPGIELLGQRARVKKRAVINHLDKLEETGEVRIYRRDGQHNYYIVCPGLTDEQEQSAVEKLADMLKTSAQAITSQFEEVVHEHALVLVHEHAPGSARTCTSTGAQACTRSVNRTVSQPPDDPKDIADTPLAVSPDEVQTPPTPQDDPPAVLPHIALIDAYWAGLPGGKPVGEDYPRHVIKAVAMINEKQITPDQVTRFMRMLYTAPGDVFEYKKWANKVIPFEEVAKLLPVWIAQNAPKPPQVLIIPDGWLDPGAQEARTAKWYAEHRHEIEILPEVVAAQARRAQQTGGAK